MLPLRIHLLLGWLILADLVAVADVAREVRKVPLLTVATVYNR